MKDIKSELVSVVKKGHLALHTALDSCPRIVVYDNAQTGNGYLYIETASSFHKEAILADKGVIRVRASFVADRHIEDVYVM